MKQSKFYPALVLGCICLAVALLLSGINVFTAPIIKDRANALADSAKTEVLPGGKNFKDITADFAFPAAVTEAFSADGGFVFRSTGKGRNGDIVIMVGVDTEGKITGTKVISEGESNGYKEKVYSRVEGTSGEYVGQTLDTYSAIIAAGATLTSNGYADAIKAALQAYAIANGASVDTRTPEQILRDNCNAALGTEGKTFARWFATEALEGIDKTYVAEDNSGFVFVIGESFIGVNADGVKTPDASDANKATASAAYTLASASTLTEIDLPEGTAKEIAKAYVTESGNYVFEVTSKGYDSLFEYSNGHISGTPQPIVFKVSISADGKIIDCVTVKHAESKGFGDKCATDEYYDGWVGATDEDVKLSVTAPDYMNPGQIPADSTDIGAITGATYTTYGYQKGVKAAFAAFELLTSNEGGNE